MILSRYVGAALALVCAGCAAPAAPDARPQMRASLQTEAVERGRVLATRTCASCHAVGRSDASRLPDAPPFRELGQRYPLDTLEESFAEGLVTSHPAMPRFVFRAGEIDDLIAYLESLKAEQ